MLGKEGRGSTLRFRKVGLGRRGGQGAHSAKQLRDDMLQAADCDQLRALVRLLLLGETRSPACT